MTARQRLIFTHLHLLEAVLGANNPQHILLGALLHLAGDEQLVEDEVGFLEVEDDVEFADVAVVLVHLLDVAVDDFEGYELIVRRVGGGDEEEGGVAAVDDLGVCRVGLSMRMLQKGRGDVEGGKKR
jgi:hypothetical protein